MRCSVRHVLIGSWTANNDSAFDKPDMFPGTKSSRPCRARQAMGYSWPCRDRTSAYSIRVAGSGIMEGCNPMNEGCHFKVRVF